MKWGYVRHAESNLFNPFIKVTSKSKISNENFQARIFKIIIKFHPNQTQITSFSFFTLILFSPLPFFYPHRSLTLALRPLLSLSVRDMTALFRPNARKYRSKTSQNQSLRSPSHQDNWKRML